MSIMKIREPYGSICFFVDLLFIAKMRTKMSLTGIKQVLYKASP